MSHNPTSYLFSMAPLLTYLCDYSQQPSAVSLSAPSRITSSLESLAQGGWHPITGWNGGGLAISLQCSSMYNISDGTSLIQASPWCQPKLLIMHCSSLLPLLNLLLPSRFRRYSSQAFCLINPLNTKLYLRVCFLEILTYYIPWRKYEIARPLVS